ncbi:MAG: hypothetical protein Q4F31_10750, partial [Eubacteriales bacterium]|nr:hypothetical protein [Eubacteriales bacterium]
CFSCIYFDKLYFALKSDQVNSLIARVKEQIYRKERDKMNILTGLIAGAVVVLAYFLGVVTGTRFLCPETKRRGGCYRDNRGYGRCQPEGEKQIFSENCIRDRKNGICVESCQPDSGSELYGSCSDFFQREPCLDPAQADPEKQKQFEEDQKAFVDCMSYSAVQAYERQNI